MKDSNPTPARPAGYVSFATTQWTRVLATKGNSPESKQALADLCKTYYEPVQQFIRRRVGNPEEADDLTHEFFESVLNQSPFEHLDPDRAKFRTYLLGAIKHFISNQARHRARQKRGSGRQPESLSDIEPESLDHNERDEDQHFDYEWAIKLMARALEVIEKEFTKADRELHFRTLKPWLVGQTESLSQKSAAKTLQLSEGAIKVAIHRLRKRFRECIKEEIANTIGPEYTIEEELRYLVQVLAHQPRSPLTEPI